MCHQPGGGGGGMHLDADTFEFGCDVLPTHGTLDIPDARLVVPGNWPGLSCSSGC